MYRDNVLYALGRDRFNRWVAYETQLSVAQQERLYRFLRRPRLKSTSVTALKNFAAEILFHELSPLELVYDFSFALNVAGDVYELEWHKPYAEKRFKQYDCARVRPPKPERSSVRLFCNFQRVPLISYTVATQLSVNSVTPHKLVRELDKRVGLFELPSLDERVWLLEAPLDSFS